MLPITDARKKLYALAQACDGQSVTFIFTSEGRPVARLVGEQEYESLMETLEVLSDKKQVVRLAAALQHAEKKKWHTHEEVFGHPQRPIK